MPAYLKRDAIRCLQASTDSLSLAIAGLAFPAQGKYGLSASTAPAIGLIGTAAELAIGACLIQAIGARALLRGDGKYLTATESLDLFRATIRESAPASAFLVQGVPDSDGHRKDLLAACSSFAMLFVARAAGLHAGRGPTRDACIAAVGDVSRFHEVLARSQRLTSYLAGSPNYPDPPQERIVLLDELVNAIDSSAELEERAALVRSAFLVLPAVPAERPDWLDPLARIAVVPTERDVTLLIAALETALPVQLKRAGAAKPGKTLAVVVRPEDPGALPIAPQYLRTEFTQIRDQWYADVGAANGRLKSGVLDLPPTASIREVFALGLEKTAVLEPGASLGPHQAWPAIASSLHDAGTPGPYWFIARRVEDMGQLRALLQQAAKRGKNLRVRLSELEEGIDAIQGNAPLSVSSSTCRSLLSEYALAEQRRAELGPRVRNCGQNRALPDDLAAEMMLVASGDRDLGPVLVRVLEANLSRDVERYWVRLLAEAAHEIEDVPALLAVLASERVSVAHTAARKAMRLIDFMTYGPPVEATSA